MSIPPYEAARHARYNAVCDSQEHVSEYLKAAGEVYVKHVEGFHFRSEDLLVLAKMIQIETLGLLEAGRLERLQEEAQETSDKEWANGDAIPLLFTRCLGQIRDNLTALTSAISVIGGVLIFILIWHFRGSLF